LTSSANIIKCKNEAVAKLVASDEVIKAMGNDDIEENDEAMYKYIFPYFYIPYTIEGSHSYICMKVIMTGRQSVNDLFGNYSVIIWVIVNQSLMQMDGVGGATRLDHLADIVETIFAGSEAFGTKRLQIIGNTEDDLDTRHRARKLTFTTTNISDMLECD
jgi:hypothetical protein